MHPFLAALLLIPALVSRSTTVSLDARGTDVREALVTIFKQAKRPYALDSSIKGTLYASFSDIPYEKALEILGRQAKLEFKEEDGVVLVRSVAPVEEPKETASPKTKPSTKPKKSSPKPTTLNKAAILAKMVTFKFSRAPIAVVFDEMGAQAGIEIVTKNVPAYRLDANFNKEPLGKALNQLCAAARLKYGFAGGKIVVEKR